jgi:predicted PurR-regulated permease PerM
MATTSAPADSSVASRWTAGRIVLGTLTACAVGVGFWLLYQYYIVPFVFFVAIVLGTAIKPGVNWFYRHGMPRPLGVVVMYIVLLTLVAGVGLLTAPLLTQQVSTIGAKLPDYYQSLHNTLMNSPSYFVRRIAWELPVKLALVPTQPATAAQAAGGSAAAQAASGQLNGVGEWWGYLAIIGSGIFVLVSILVLAFYWTLDGERSLRSLLLRSPVEKRDELRDLIAAMETKVSAYLIGQTIVCLSVGMMALVAYLIIGLPYALVLAVLAALLETVPVIGPILGAVPPSLLALSLAPGKFIWVIVAVIVIQQIENNLLVPRVMDRSVGVNPIVTILAIAAFASLFGLAGALLAIPMAAIVQVLINRFVLNPTPPDLEAPIGRDRVSILRYEAQQLVQDARKQVRRKEDSVGIETDQVEDMIESIAADLDSVLAQTEPADTAAAAARSGV